MGRTRTSRKSSAPGEQAGVTLSKEIDGEPRLATTSSPREISQLRAEGYREVDTEAEPEPDAGSGIQAVTTTTRHRKAHPT